MNSVSSQTQTPHAVCVPFPAQGHINPMLQLAKLLHLKGFHITFVNNEYSHRRLLRAQGSVALADRPSFRFRTISDGLPSADADKHQDFPALCASFEQHGAQALKELICGLNEADDVPRVSCIIADLGMVFSLDVAEEFGIVGFLLWTASACGFLSYAKSHELLELGLIPFKDSNFTTSDELNRVIDWLPGIENFRIKDMVSIIRITDSDDFYFTFMQRVLHKSQKASAILLNSVNALEHDVLEALSSKFPPIYPLGPLQLLFNSINTNNKDKDEDTNSISTSLLKEDPKCVEWLDSQAPKSVIYINFGSVTVMTNDQLLEFAWGIANSKRPFLWITRHDLVNGDYCASDLLKEFSIETKHRGYISGWCNQEQVLAHPAIGGFLTHCGWNSTLESIINGVPVICWPFFAEQYTNCWYCCNMWGIGMEIDANVKRSEVERQVNELMEGDKGKGMGRNAMNLKRLAYEAITAPNGSSYKNFEKVVQMLGSGS